MKKLLILFLLPLLQFHSQAKLPDNMEIDRENGLLTLRARTADGLYSIAEVRTISLTFEQSNWWQLLSENYISKTDIPATLEYNGETYEGVGVRFRGQTSYQKVNTQKKSFNISVDFTDEDLNIEGYKTLNLTNNYEDPSFIREALYSYSVNKYMPTAKVNFVRLEINGENWGLYSNVQQLNNDFIDEWFVDNDGTRWRAEAPDTAERNTGGPGGPGMMPIMPPPTADANSFAPMNNNGNPPPMPPHGFSDRSNNDMPDPPHTFFMGMPEPPPGGGGQGAQFGAGTSSLNYLGNDYKIYTSHYSLKTNEEEPNVESWNALVRACDSLNNAATLGYFDRVKNVLDIDRALWQMACEIIFADEDGYVSKGGMDYYVYLEPECGRITPVDYDANSTFQHRGMNWPPFYKEQDTLFALNNKLFAIPELRQRYLAHVRTIINDVLHPEVLDPVIEGFAELINETVEQDDKKLYTISQFNSELESLKEFVSSRRDFFINLPLINAESPEILNVAPAATGAVDILPGQPVPVSANVSNSDGIFRVVLYYSFGLTGSFNRMVMNDDGQGADISAGDNIYTATLPGAEAGEYMRYYIEAISDDQARTVAYSPAGAEHDVYVYLVEAPVQEQTDIVINELMAANDNTISDPQGDYDDWIELYNNSDQDIDLSSYYLTDKNDNLTKWQFPESTILAHNEYLIIWADEDGKDSPGLHANFKLSASGESVKLTRTVDGATVILDAVEFGEMSADISYARQPNATGEFTQSSQATPNAYNGNISVADNSNINTHILYPNPVINLLSIEFDSAKLVKRLTIIDNKGATVHVYPGRNVLSAPGCLKIDTSSYTPGPYHYRLDTDDNVFRGSFIVKK